MNEGSTRIILSSNGSQQGCPGGTFLFCLGLAPKLAHIALAIPESYIGAIIDDLTVCTPICQIPHVIEVVSQQLGEYNIRLSLPKSLIYTSPQTHHLIPANTPAHIRRTSEGFKSLGSPISEARESASTLITMGNDNYHREFYRTLLQKNQIISPQNYQHETYSSCISNTCLVCQCSNWALAQNKLSYRFSLTLGYLYQTI